MALTGLQRDVCRLLAASRRDRRESYIAGGAALSVALDTARLSRDLDIFHDAIEAVARSWDADRMALERAGYDVRTLRERPGYVEGLVSRHGASIVMEWARDSAFRFFPLVEHEDLGLTLHPFDLATNKVLALVGRLEARDWIDAIDATSGSSRSASWPGRRAGRIRGSPRPESWNRPGGRRGTRTTRSRRWHSKALPPRPPTCRGAGARRWTPRRRFLRPFLSPTWDTPCARPTVGSSPAQRPN